MPDLMTQSDWLRAEAIWGQPCLHDPDRLEEAADDIEDLLTTNADLLAALEAMLKTHGFTSNCTACKQARAAIAKVRPQATSSYLNKPRRSLEQAVRDNEGKL